MAIFAILGILRRDSRWSTVKIVLLLSLSCVILFFVFPEQIGNLTKRVETYFQHSNPFSQEAINRKEVWKSAFRYFLKEPTLFGKGMYNVSSLYYSVGFFHSLYFTMLYKIGILGLLICSIFWLKMLHESWRILIAKNKRGNWYTVFFLSISVVLILIDGIKIEYLRYGHTIQFVWVIYGLLIAAIRQSRGNNENTMVP
jgi:O-antigen ligase